MSRQDYVAKVRRSNAPDRARHATTRSNKERAGVGSIVGAQDDERQAAARPEVAGFLAALEQPQPREQAPGNFPVQLGGLTLTKSTRVAYGMSGEESTTRARRKAQTVKPKTG